MLASIKAEFRKLLTVRSTYVISALALALVVFFAFYIQGYKLDPAALQDPFQLAGNVTGAVSAVAIFVPLVAILLMTHEYRHNTIMYTLTSSNSRSKVLLAKIVVVSVFAAIFTLFVAVLSPVMSYLGVLAQGNELVPQTLHYSDLLWRCLFFGWGYGLAGLLLAVLIRSQVGSIAALFIVPGVIEQLLGLLLKHNVKYLPFTAHSQVINPSNLGADSLSPGKAALIFSSYLVVGWIVAWVLFLRRDAN